jgi:hypothetical protein
LNNPALKKYGVARPDLVMNSPKRMTPCSTQNAMNSRRKSDTVFPYAVLGPAQRNAVPGERVN